jgi:hypothetical protein
LVTRTALIVLNKIFLDFGKPGASLFRFQQK